MEDAPDRISLIDAGVLKPRADEGPKVNAPQGGWRQKVGEALPSVLGAAGGAGGALFGPVGPFVGAPLGGAFGRMAGNALQGKDWSEGVPRAAGEQELYQLGGTALRVLPVASRIAPWIDRWASNPEVIKLLESSGLAGAYRMLANPYAPRIAGETVAAERRPR